MDELKLLPLHHDKAQHHLLKAFETIFNRGLQEGNLNTALRCLELISRKYKFLEPKQTDLDIDLSEDKLDKLLEILKKKRSARS